MTNEEKKMELVPNEEPKQETEPKTETPAEEKKESFLKKAWNGAKTVGKKAVLPLAIGGTCVAAYVFGEKTGLNKALKTLKPAEDPDEDEDSDDSYDEDDDNDDETSDEEDEE